jgi:hypothetical protein
MAAVKYTFFKEEDYNVNGAGQKLYYKACPVRNWLADKETIVIFLRPLKTAWPKESCKKGQYGVANNPLTNMWLQLNNDFTTLKEDFTRISFVNNEPIKDTILLKKLNNKQIEFTLGIDEPIVITPLFIKIKFQIVEFFNNIKEKWLTQKKQK